MNGAEINDMQTTIVNATAAALGLSVMVAVCALRTTSKAEVVEQQAAGWRTGGDDAVRARRGVVDRGGCVPRELQTYVTQQSVRNKITLSLASRDKSNDGDAIALGGGPLFGFYPMAGNPGRDIFNGGFVDIMSASPSFADYACRPWTYDGHEGTDTEIRSFGEQFGGIPVFAARDGVVVFAQDGYPDTNIFGGVQGNIIAIDHGGGLETQYYHLKLNSVIVTVGQTVKAGQQIGMVGSSGNSFGPHLHFQTMLNGVVHEPFAGPCRAGPSGWVDQAPLDSDELILHDFAMTRTDLDTLDPPWWQPWELPGHAQFSTSDAHIFFWFRALNFPEDCPWRVRFYRPNGTVATDASWTWGNPEIYRFQKSWFGFDFQPMSPVPGTWRLLFELDGQVMIDTPFEVVAGAVNPAFNRAPAAITAALNFEPAIGATSAPARVRITTLAPPAMEDPDWDIVRYRYLWKINNVVKRDVTTAAQSDMLPGGLGCAGATITCEITPTDGSLTAPTATASASAIIPGPPTPDLNCDGIVGAADLGILLGSWGTPGCGGGSPCPADLNGDNNVNAADLGILLGAWG